MDYIETASRLADEVLFPAALATDAADAVPMELLDALADAGLYGAGVAADFGTVCAVQEALAGGCLTTGLSGPSTSGSCTRSRRAARPSCARAGSSHWRAA